MVEKKLFEFKPDYAVLPGDTLREILQNIGMSQAELAERTGRPPKTINEIIKGKTSITPETALQLERVLGVPASFWNNLESNFNEAEARKEERKKLKRNLKWMTSIPWNQMVKYNWIRKADNEIDQLKEVLNFFGIANPKSWRILWNASGTAYRKSNVFRADPWAISAWLRKGQIEALKIKCSPYNKSNFQRALESIRTLTAKSLDVFIPAMRELCAASGVAVAFVRELPKSRVSGASQWLTPEKALIQLSLRYKSTDHLWFTFFHEAGHILLHGKRDVFIDEDHPGGSRKEDKASQFAADMLIPPDELKVFVERGNFSESSIIRFARRVNTTPGLIVGRLQHDNIIRYNTLNHLRQKIELERIEDLVA